jgi:tripartite-type tricarboxylate transporter receptor subunit TctC
MKSRICVLGVFALSIACFCGTVPAVAVDYPARPVRWVVPYPPGGATDLVARLMGQWLAKRLGQPFVVENKAGAGGNIGTQAVISSPPDGYTLLLVATANASNTALYDQLPFNFLRDTTPVAGLISMPLVMITNPSVPAKTVAEFIAFAKANHGSVRMGSPGIGTAVHLSGELFKSMTGVDLIHVPYRGGAPAMTDLIGGQVQVMFDLLPQAIGQIRGGNVRALAVTTATRAPELPNAPTISDTISGFDSSSWFGLAVPKGTPPEVVAILNREINAGLLEPGIRARLAEVGATPLVMTSVEFGAHLAAETEKWAKVIRAANIKAQ